VAFHPAKKKSRTAARLKRINPGIMAFSERPLDPRSHGRTESRFNVEDGPAGIAEPGLVRKAQSGDADSFATLYRMYRGAVYATCLRRLRDASLAEDAVQDTFLRAYSSFDRFDEKRPLLPWLHAIAARRCVDVARRSAKTTVAADVDDGSMADAEPDPTLARVIAAEERRRLTRALEQLVPRQRRALLLHAVEGWSYADIAEAEGISVTSTKSLLFHARSNLRRACRRGTVGTLLIAGAALRKRARRGADWVRVRAQIDAEPLVRATGGSLASGVTVLVLAVAGVAGPSFSPDRAPSGPIQEQMASRLPGGISASVRPAIGPRPSDPRHVPLAGPLFDPARGAKPKDTRFTSFAPSPNYESDHTILAAGTVPCAREACAVLFRSTDGGASWTRVRARSFRGYRLLLPPAYPADPRIFAMGPAGLQVSEDAGQSFRVVFPVEGEAAISPLFNAGDPRILIATGSVFEYWADDGVVKPASLVAPAGLRLTVAFSPSFPSDERFFVGGLGIDDRGVQRPSIHRCAGVICRQTLLPAGAGVPSIRLAPGFGSNRTALGFTTEAMFRSKDSGESFFALSKPGATTDAVGDLLILDDAGEAIVAAMQGSGKSIGGVYRSTDGGRTWAGAPLALPGFDGGITNLARVGNRLLASGGHRGIAYSDDGGRTWVEASSS
jgi:RNA polymerase sigma factor (sigma-70 family)